MSRIMILVVIAVIAIIGILLTWVSVDTGGVDVGDVDTTQSGLDMVGDVGLGSTSILLIPLASLVIIGLVYLYKTTAEKRWLYCLIASAVTLIPVLWLFFWKQKDVNSILNYGIGFWINLVAAIAMVALCGYTVYQSRAK